MYIYIYIYIYIYNTRQKYKQIIHIRPNRNTRFIYKIQLNGEFLFSTFYLITFYNKLVIMIKIKIKIIY